MSKYRIVQKGINKFVIEESYLVPGSSPPYFYWFNKGHYKSLEEVEQAFLDFEAFGNGKVIKEIEVDDEV